MLNIVPTPLGNLADISQRAKDALQDCNFIISENPSSTHKLLQLLKLPKKEIVQFADHNELKVLDKYITRLKTDTACLVSDAGTPGISDPGFRLVRACRQTGIKISSLPGPSAAITALAASGLPTDRFLFVGFFQKTESKVIEVIRLAQQTGATLIAYESPQRIIKTLEYIYKNFDKETIKPTIVIARELTKVHEEYLTGTAEELLETLKARPSIKGEITLLLSFK
jgi:16S rRNA (cytidine1402-2'-O)-methyltransferase